MEIYKTSHKAKIRFNGRTYTRRVYEFLDDDTKWWRDCVKQGAMCGCDPNAFIVLDSFEDVTVIEEAIGMPGKWMPR